MKYDLVVYIGRFQPFHVAHQETLRRAAQLADNVLVLVGSSESPRTVKNPWSYEEREQMIRGSSHILNLVIKGIKDYTYDDNEWIKSVGSTVKEVASEVGAKSIAVIGHDKDHSSFYLNYFPQWKFEAMPKFPSDGESIDATKIRNLIFKGDYEFIRGVVPDRVFSLIMRNFVMSDKLEALREEWNYIKAYKKSWELAPFPPTFVTTDAVVIQSGHVLLVQRGQSPGKGLWATPGGFINEFEKLEDGMLRELKEETRLKVPLKVLRGCIKGSAVYDEPSRSTRGRTITHTYLIHLDDAASLPKVKGSDDAMDAKWFPLSEFENMESVMLEDHWHMVNNLINRNF